MKNIIMFIVIALMAAGIAFYFTHKSFVLGRVGMSFTNKPLAAEKTDSIGNVPKGGKRILVAYFSWGGNTRKLAQDIHKQVGGDIVEIRPVKPYPEGYKETVKVAREEYAKELLPAIEVAKLDMADYDTIILGYPIWYYREPLVISQFLKQHDLNGKTILPFATSGGSTIEASIPYLEKYAPKANIGEPLLANDKALVEPWLKRNKAL